MSKTKVCVLGGVLYALLSPFSQLSAQTQLDETVSVLEQWVETERKISSESSNWESDKAMMKNLIAIYEEELKDLDQQLDEAEDFTSAAEKKRAEYSDREAEVKELERQVVDAIIKAEIEMKTLYPLLPGPLQEELTPLFNSLPEDSQSSKVAIGSRIQPIVAILTQVQKFDQVVTIVNDLKEFEAGRTVQTETIYFGLGAAYYVDLANENAGVGVLTDTGWTWEVNNALAPQLRQFIEIYRGTKQAEYVPLPVKLN